MQRDSVAAVDHIAGLVRQCAVNQLLRGCFRKRLAVLRLKTAFIASIARSPDTRIKPIGPPEEEIAAIVSFITNTPI